MKTKCETCGKINGSGMWTKNKQKRVVWICPECITQDMLNLSKEELKSKKKNERK